MTYSKLKRCNVVFFVCLAFLVPHASFAQSDGSVRLKLSLGNNTASDTAGDTADASRLSNLSEPNLALTIEDSQPMDGTVRSRRAVALSEDSIVIRLLSANGQVLFEDVKPDPRVIRDEIPDAGAGGDLVNRKLYQNDTAFLIDVPEIATAAILQILKPTIVDGGYQLTLLSSVDI